MATSSHRRRHRLFLSFSVLAVAAACGVEDRVLSSGSSPGSVDMDTAIARFALASCDRLQTCSPPVIIANHGNYDRCIERTKLINTWISGLPDVDHSPSFYVDCAVAWNNRPCEDIFSPVPMAACRRPGKRTNGQPCNFADQCTSGFCKQNGYECGTCADQPATGSSCEKNQDCNETDWCMPDKTCHMAGGLNQPCSDNLKCRDDLTCSGGVCIARQATVGGSCDIASARFCDFLNEGMYCTSSGTCAAAAVKSPGESCGPGTYCSATSFCSNGTCVAAAADNGGACGDSGPYCEWPATCVAGKCQGPTSVALCSQ
jgi:hypothetical protein